MISFADCICSPSDNERNFAYLGIDLILLLLKQLGLDKNLPIIYVVNRCKPDNIIDWSVDRCLVNEFIKCKELEEISIEGLVGVGKSHLVELLKRECGKDFIFVPEPSFLLYLNIKNVSMWIDEFKCYLRMYLRTLSKKTIVYERAPGTFNMMYDVFDPNLIEYKKMDKMFVILGNTNRVLDDIENETYSFNEEKYVKFLSLDNVVIVNGVSSIL
ncbi:MAG: hypothetical protein ACRC0V_00775 [Fusobacteriaceae bacterium]